MRIKSQICSGAACTCTPGDGCLDQSSRSWKSVVRLFFKFALLKAMAKRRKGVHLESRINVLFVLVALLGTRYVMNLHLITDWSKKRTKVSGQ